MRSAPDVSTYLTEGEVCAAMDQLLAKMRLLLAEVQEERRRLHIERHAIFQIVIQEGNLPTLHRLADMLEEQTDRHGKVAN